MPLPVLIAVWVVMALAAVAGLVTVTIGWSQQAWVSAEVDGNVKTIQAIVLGLGFLGVVAGAVVTYRRQQTMQDQLEEDRNRLDHDRKRLEHERSNDQDRLEEDRRKYQLELDRFAQEQAKYAQEQVRETERRRQERYAQGAQMLADQSQAVRIAGLNVIAALGREVASEDELRQTCVNLMCAYLRASSPAQAEEQEKPSRDDPYRVVAAEACRLLPTLLEDVPAPDDTATTPPGLDLDLRRVNLIDLNLSGRTIGTLRCEQSSFSGDARFGGARFGGDAWFGGARFGGKAGFGGARFGGKAGFVQARFGGKAGFVQARFGGEADFFGARFGGEADFGEVTFGRHADFGEATFGRHADFGEATFGGEADFGEATFGGEGNLFAATFGGATFGGYASFSVATFFRYASFSGATFGDEVTFSGVTFGGPARFGGVTFGGKAGFVGATFREDDGPKALGAAEFAVSEPFDGAVFGLQQQDDDSGEEVSSP